MEGGASRATLPEPKINAEISALDREILTRKVFSFSVGSEDEPRKDHSFDKPQIAHKITTTLGLSRLKEQKSLFKEKLKKRWKVGFMVMM